MAVSPCNTATDGTQRELVEHGNLFFPIACYQDDLYLDPVPWHWHEEFEYAIAVGDKCTFLVENTEVALRPGDGIFLNSQSLHAVEAPRSFGPELRSAVFHPRLISAGRDTVFWEALVAPLLNDARLRYLVLKPEIPWQARTLDHFYQSWNALDQEPEDFENLVRYHLSAALHLIVVNSPLSAKMRSKQEEVDAARIRGMLDYIHGNFADDLTMDDISRSVNASSSVCLRCFRQMLGTTPIQYLKNYRLEKAAHLLKTTRLPIKDVALDCGFNDMSYFTKAFREKTGTTPKEYRSSENGKLPD